jgi:hypothetical protein
MKPGRHEWDEQVINSCMFPHDAREVLKIRLLQRHEEDILVRHYERTGVLMVRVHINWPWLRIRKTNARREAAQGRMA